MVEHLGDGPQRRQRVGAVADRVDEHRAGADPPDLNQVGAVGVAETRRPLGIHRERPMAAVQESRGAAIWPTVTESSGTPSAGCRSGVGAGSVLSGSVLSGAVPSGPEAAGSHMSGA